MRKIKHIAAALLSSVMMMSSMTAVNFAGIGASAASSTTVEYLNRGVSAINTGNGMLVSWHFNADDSDSAVFKLYRDNVLIYTSESGKATSYLDAQGSSKSVYRVDTIENGKVVSSEKCGLISDKSWLDIPLDVPKGGTDNSGAAYSYTAGDCSVGDVDGDGQYEIFLKWDPTNAKDNSNWGDSGKVYIDCYRLTGEKLWRIDLGKNIRAGAHYTQFLVADFDLDGKAEMTCKTCDGTVDGTGKVIGDASKDYRNEGGHIITGPEYYTLFDGETGAALDTVNYEYPRGVASGDEAKKTWGDNYGNRCERYLGAVMYCDGVKPSAVSVRGYYTRMTVVAYDVVNKKLVKRWGYDTGFDPSKPGYANGNHNCMSADVDEDGKQELVLGATCIDDNGKVLWCNKKGHGDAMHLADFIPERKGLEVWVCHEHTPFGVSLLDAATGEAIFHFDGDKDTGRCAAGNVYAENPGSEFWGARPAKTTLDQNGNKVAISPNSMNFLIYWDGDLERELLDNITITKINPKAQWGFDILLEAKGCASCNSTKATPCLSADIFGDWREELVLKTEDSKYLRIYCTPYQTDVRLTTLMHDVHYRTQVAGEQTGYNQPPHTGFFLGTKYNLPEKPNVNVLDINKGSTPAEPEKDYHIGESEEYIPGDLNRDGVVNVFDLMLLKRHINKSFLIREDKQRADLNADGKNTKEDVISFQKYLIKADEMPIHKEKKSFSYAIDAKWNEGVTEKTNAGFKDEAYINLDNKVGSYIDWEVHTQSDGNYLCTFGIANGSNANRIMKIEVNDGKDCWMQDFLTTGAWTTWEERGIVLPLKKGKNKIRMTSVTEQGGPNLDYLKTEWTDEPIAEIYTETAPTDPVQPPQSNQRTIYIAGDSTVQTYNASYAPQQGWGAFLYENMPDGVTIANRAIAGRSSKSFYDNGRLDSILNEIKEGDYLLVQFGINDSAASKAERYAPTCGNIPGTDGSFEYYMAKYIEGAKAKGAVPIMVTTVIGLKAYSNGKFVNSYQNYCDSMKKLASYYKIPVVDLNSLMVAHYNQIGYDAAYKYHMCSTGSTDTTHFTETGAKAVAKLVADEMKKQGLV